jgi:hypothetical protein
MTYVDIFLVPKSMLLHPRRSTLGSNLGRLPLQCKKRLAFFPFQARMSQLHWDVRPGRGWLVTSWLGKITNLLYSVGYKDKISPKSVRRSSLF